MDDTTRIRPVYLLGSHCPSAPPSLVVICGPDIGRRIPLALPVAHDRARRRLRRGGADRRHLAAPL